MKSNWKRVHGAHLKLYHSSSMASDRNEQDFLQVDPQIIVHQRCYHSVILLPIIRAWNLNLKIPGCADKYTVTVIYCSTVVIYKVPIQKSCEKILSLSVLAYSSRCIHVEDVSMSVSSVSKSFLQGSNIAAEFNDQSVPEQQFMVSCDVNTMVKVYNSIPSLSKNSWCIQ